MKTYKTLINELSLTKLVRYREAASKSVSHLKRTGDNIKVPFDDYPQHDVMRGTRQQMLKSALGKKANKRFYSVATATKKITKKMSVSKLNKPLEK